MISEFYRKHSNAIIAFVLFSFPFATYFAETIPGNNDIETWLPDSSRARDRYDAFRSDFGADECIAVGYKSTTLAPAQSEAVCRRLERLQGVRRCWSPDRLQDVMSDLEVTEADAHKRLTSLVRSENSNYCALLVLLDDWGVAHRGQVVDAVRSQIGYCDIHSDDVALSGSPVIVTELDRLGNRDNNKVFFIVTLAICLALLHFTVKSWKLSLVLLGLTVWAINCTLAIMHLGGAEMNFILSALPVLVMVFTLAVSIHYLHQFRHSASDDPLTESVRTIWKPAALATLTTVIGLCSLAVSSIGPVRQFGLAAAVGSVFALIAGLGVLPAVLLRLGYEPVDDARYSISVHRVAWGLINNSRTVTAVVVGLVVVCGFGLPWLASEIDPIEFLPNNSAVLQDVREIESNLTSADSLEIVIDFGLTDMAFFDRVAEVHRVQSLIDNHPSIGHTLSLASFLPSAAMDGTMSPTALLAKSRGQDNSAFVADAERKWRISARLTPGSRMKAEEIMASIRTLTADSVAPITITGLTPVLDRAQQDIFEGFWESFATAFLLISAVMFLALRSLKAGLLAMIPNLTPICIVFGVLGWIGVPVDIGTMMTASIALGLAVDGTFHFLFAHHRIRQQTTDSHQSTQQALCQTGLPILQAAVISAVGMLALTLSNFKPTVRFGCLMFALLLTALLGDLVLLPAILAFRRVRSERKKAPVPDPHFAPARERSAIHA